MDLDYSAMFSEESSDSSELLQESTHLEECYIAGELIQLPQGLCENKSVFKEFFSQRTWRECFTEQQRQHLKNFLPNFPENSVEEKEETIRRLFARENMRFGSPLSDFQAKLKNGNYRPDVAKMHSLMKKAQLQEYKYQQRQYYFHLMKEILVSRQQLLETAFSQPPGTLPKMDRIPHHPSPHSSPVEQRTKRRYFQELAAVRQEVGESDHSSEDDNYPEGPPPRMSKKQKKQLATLECSLSPDMNHVISTVALKPSGFDLESNVTSTCNPYEMNEDIYKGLLMNHKKRRLEGDDHPELNILGITTQDISNRTQLGKRIIINRIHQSVGYETKTPTRKRNKADSISSRGLASVVTTHISPMRHSQGSPQGPGDYSSNGSEAIDSEDEEGPYECSFPEDMERVDVEGDGESSLSGSKTASSPNIRTPVVANRNKRTNSSGSSPRSNRTNNGNSGTRNLLLRQVKVETEEDSSDIYPNYNINFSSSEQFHTHSNSVGATAYSGRHIKAATLSDLDGIDMMTIPVDLTDTAADAVQINIDNVKSAPELMQDTHACFFSLIRDIICSTPEHRMALSTLEERLRAWQENPITPLNDWYSLVDCWLVMLTSAISFLTGDFPDVQPEDFVPYVEYKSNLQTYQWIGAGRDSDSHLQPLCQYWLDHKDEMTSRPLKDEELDEEDAGGEERVISPPPPRYPTNWVVHPSTPEEKECFREQERLRYENPHKAFTFRMHNYESVVGPVKGVYNQSIGMNKPRGHSLLVADRPNFVTILALVRDATARLPNGEGTRTDICELLKDSQYLAPVTQESYLHSVVSGALDRLHYETDPCVKYDTKRKIWIYLHRGRTEEEFERLHQQQQGMAKTKKTSSQRKTCRNKQQKDNVAPVKESASPMVSSSSSSSSQQITITSSESPVSATMSVPSIPNSPVQTGISTVSTSLPVVTSSVKTPPLRASRNPLVQRTYTLAPGQSVQNLQMATSSGLQTVQVTGSQTVLAGKSLLTTPATHQQLISSSVVKTSAVTSQPSSPASTNTAAPMQKTVTLMPQNVQAVSAARGIAVASLRDSNSTISAVTLKMPTSSLVGNISSSSPTTVTEIRTTMAAVVSTPSSSLQQQKVSVSSRQPSVSSPKAVVNVTSSHLMNVSQLQLVGSKSPQTVSSPKQQSSGKALVTTSLSGMKLVNTVKAEGPQQQTIFIKQQQAEPQPRTVIGSIQQQPHLQHSSKQAATIAQLQQQLKQLQQKQQQQQAGPVGGATTTSSSQRVVTTVSVLNQGQCQGRVMARVSGKPSSHIGVQQQPVAIGQNIAGASGSTLMKQQQPVVAKVLTSAQGQVITMESLMAHQKQHGALPQGTPLRMTTGGKPGQTSLIQIPNSTQFAVVSQGNLLSMGQSRVLQTQLPQQVHSSSTNIQQQAVTIQQPQPQATKLVTAVAKPLVAGTSNTATTTNLRLLSPTSGSLNLAHVGGKPLLLASKAQSSPLQGTTGQNVILTSQATGGHQTVVLASQALRAQGGTLLLQQGGAQQILLPSGFQGGTLNIKTLQGLQGLKVIPLSQGAASASNKGRQQVYARIISPGIRPTATNISHQNTTTVGVVQDSSNDSSPCVTQQGSGASSSTE